LQSCTHLLELDFDGRKVSKVLHQYLQAWFQRNALQIGFNGRIKGGRRKELEVWTTTVDLCFVYFFTVGCKQAKSTVEKADIF